MSDNTHKLGGMIGQFLDAIEQLSRPAPHDPDSVPSSPGKVSKELEDRLDNLEQELEMLRSNNEKLEIGINNALSMISILTKSLVNLSLQVQALYNKLEIDPKSAVEDMFDPDGRPRPRGEDPDDPDFSGPGGGMGGMIN